MRLFINGLNTDNFIGAEIVFFAKKGEKAGH